MSAGDTQPRCFDTPRMRGLSRERDAVLETIARETEKLIHVNEVRERGRREKSDEKKGRREMDDGTTTKSRAWLERRDDGAGKGERKRRKKKRSME